MTATAGQPPSGGGGSAGGSASQTARMRYRIASTSWAIQNVEARTPSPVDNVTNHSPMPHRPRANRPASLEVAPPDPSSYGPCHAPCGSGHISHWTVVGGVE